MKNTLFGKDILTTESLSRETIESVCKKADEMEKLVTQNGGDDRLKGRILAAMFYEPSSRTFSSFVTAMQRLGGGFIPLHGMSYTSVTKGETLEDTARVFSSYADVLVVRHPEPGAVKLAADYAQVPVINAGDGVGEHPSQALIDFYTIQKHFPDTNKLHILMIGDLAHYRPTNSLAKLLTNFPGVKMSFATPSQVPLPDGVRKYLKDRKADFGEYEHFEDILGDADVLYVTRVKKEYMSAQLYEKVQGSYVINRKSLEKMKKNSIVMHCLPRVGEISTDIDSDSRSVYLNKQVRYGLYVRMAILDLILGKQK